MRNMFVKTLLRIAKEDKDVILVTGDLGFDALEPFKDGLPRQYINIGVAEQDMISVAAGLAHSGKKVFAYSIIPFATMRCFEQIRNDVAYHNFHVTIVGVGAGYSYSVMGATHHAIEDYGILKTLPNMRIVCPGDPVEVECAVEAFYKNPGCGYLRLARRGEPETNKRPLNFTIGKANEIIAGNDLTIISIGHVLDIALECTKKLKEGGLEAQLLSMHTVKPIDEEAILSAAKKTRAVFTVEEHNVIGGAGQDIATILLRSGVPVLFYNFGIQDQFTSVVGKQDYLRELQGLTAQQITEKILNRYTMCR